MKGDKKLEMSEGNNSQLFLIPLGHQVEPTRIILNNTWKGWMDNANYGECKILDINTHWIYDKFRYLQD